MVEEQVAQPAGAAFSGLCGQLIAEEAGSGLHENQAHKAGRGEEQFAPETALFEDVIHEPAQEDVNTRAGSSGNCQHQGGEQIVPMIAGHQPPKRRQTVFTGNDRLRVKSRVFFLLFLHHAFPMYCSRRYS